MSAWGQNQPFRPVPFNDRNTLKSGNQKPERRLTTAKRKSPHVFPDFRLVPNPEERLSPAPAVVVFGNAEEAEI